MIKNARQCMLKWGLAAIALFAITQCSPKYTVHTVNNDLRQSLQKAELLIQQEKYDEALLMIQPLLEVYPDEPRALAVANQAQEKGAQVVEQPKYLGFNYAVRKDANAGVLERIAWYIPDRILDTLDVVSASFGFGYSFGLGVWATRYGQLKLKAAYTYGPGLYQKRNLGIYGGGGAEVALGPIEAAGLGEARVGTNGVDSIIRSVGGTTDAGDLLYQKYRDLWGIGADIGLILWEVRAEIHPVEIADWIAGFFFIDFLNDDLGATDRFQLDRRQWELYNKNLSQVNGMDEVQEKIMRNAYPTLFSKPE